jgi:hypothetical protein
MGDTICDSIMKFSMSYVIYLSVSFFLFSLYSLIICCIMFQIFSFNTLLYKVLVHLPGQTVGTTRNAQRQAQYYPLVSLYVSTHWSLFKQASDEKGVSG